MDHSVYGYLSRRAKEELEQIIAMYGHLRQDAFYAQVLKTAEYFLQIRKNEEDATP